MKISSYYETGVKKFIKHSFGKLKKEKILASDSNAVVFFIITGINFPYRDSTAHLIEKPT